MRKKIFSGRSHFCYAFKMARRYFRHMLALTLAKHRPSSLANQNQSEHKSEQDQVIFQCRAVQQLEALRDVD